MTRSTPDRLRAQEKAGPILEALRRRYGRLRRPRRDPLEVLIRGVLSQNTTDLNSARAYGRLKETFGSWENLARAHPSAIEKAIEQAGLAAQKAATIKSILRWLQQQGGYSLEFLRAMPPQEAERTLRVIKGVGIKTARLVLLFGFGRPVFVVDTHVLRVAQRLGLIPRGCTRTSAHALLDRLVPDRRKYEAHISMIRLGRETCRPRSPLCDACPVRPWCWFARMPDLA